MVNVLIVGVGAMGFSIARALHASKNKFSVQTCDRNPSGVLAMRAQDAGISCVADINDCLKPDAAYDIIVPAVKPAVVPYIARQLAQFIAKQKPTVLSIAAGVPMSTIAAALSDDSAQPYPHVARAMPTIAARVGRSITALCFSDSAVEVDKARARAVVDNLGSVLELPEKQIDAFTGVAGSGIAFAAAFMEAMTLAGVREGLPRAHAYKSARESASGALALLQESYDDTSSNDIAADTRPVFDTPADLINAVASPGGTTIAGIHALHEHGMPAAVMNAVRAAAEKATQLSQ